MEQNPVAPLTQHEYEQLAAFRYALRQYLHFSEAAARSADMTPHQYQALLAIRGFPHEKPILMGQLAKELQLRLHTTAELVNRMVEQDLVRREQDSVDRRKVYAYLTPRGRAMLDKLAAVHWADLRRLTPQLMTAMSTLLELGEDYG